MGSLEYDVFLSYARRDDAAGWVSGLRDAIYDDFREFSSEPFRIFFDTEEIVSHQDWEVRLREGLRSSRVLLVCLSPSYLRSNYCRWEWEEFARMRARRIASGDAVTGVYFVELGGDEDYDTAVAAWRHEVERTQFEQLAPWFADGVAALQETEVRRRVKALGYGVYEQIRQARLSSAAPGNLRRHNPLFVGRVAELRALRAQLSGGAVGVVTALHGIGGMGKTELAVTYAHAYAHDYQGGTWQVDADGQTDMLAAVSALALSPELGLHVSEQHLNDRAWLGRRVLARLEDLTEAARANDAETASCLLLLDNVSESMLLSASQLGVLPDKPWFHVVVTTRLGGGDIGAIGVRAAVAMIEVGGLDAGDALALIRDHQPARDQARLHTEFSSPAEADAARAIVELLGCYTLAVEHAAVYLGSSGVEPSELLAVLRVQGTALLDEVGASPAGSAAILHKERLTGAIVDQTLMRLHVRARAALSLACLLPPDSVPWDWLEQLTPPAARAASAGLRGLTNGDDWTSTRRMLEGRRLLTAADDARFARLHRVLADHLRSRLGDPDAEDRLDAYLQQLSKELGDAATTDRALLAVTVATLTSRLCCGRDGLAVAARTLFGHALTRLDLAAVHSLAAATLPVSERIAAADPGHGRHQRDLSVDVSHVGHARREGGDTAGAHAEYTRALGILERLVAQDPSESKRQRDLVTSLNNVGDMQAAGGDTAGALESYARALSICERLAAADPSATARQRHLITSLWRVGGMQAAGGDTAGALESYIRALSISERIIGADPSSGPNQSDFATSLAKVGDMQAASGDAVSALGSYIRTVQIFERLSAADPGHTGHRRELAVGLAKVADMQAAGGDSAGALERYTHALDIFERLAAADPTRTEHQRDLAVSLDEVAQIQAASGDTVGALERYTRALHIFEHLAAADPDRTEHQRELFVMAYKVASALEAASDASNIRYWATAHGALASLEAAGTIRDSDRVYLAEIRGKLGRQ